MGLPASFEVNMCISISIYICRYIVYIYTYIYIYVGRNGICPMGMVDDKGIV